MAYVLDILKEVQVVFLNIQYDLHGWEKGQETVGILTRLCHKKLRPAHPDIASDILKDTTHGNGGIHVACQQYIRDHGCGGGLSMGSGHSHRLLIVAHHLPQEFSPGKHGNPLFLYRHELRIILMDGRRIHHHINPRLLLNIGSPLAVIHPCPSIRKAVCKLCLMGIRASDRKPFFQKDLGQAAHADASDSYKMNMFWFAKIYLIHNKLSFPVPSRLS